MINSIFKKIYAIVRRIPKGKVMTYGEVAKQLKINPRLVGWALHANKNANVPCHRVVGKNGYLAGYVQGLLKKRELLKKEGVKFVNNWQVAL